MLFISFFKTPFIKEQEMETKKTWLETLILALKSRTVWSFILSMISAVVYFKTGGILETVGVDSPDVTFAVEQASLLISALAGLGVPYFRVNLKAK